MRRSTLIRVPRVITATAAVFALAAGLPGLAHAAPRPVPQQQPGTHIPTAPSGVTAERLPAGWRLDGEGADRELVWRSREPVPMGDARVEFYAGDRLIGRPTAAKDGRTFRLPLDDARAQLTDELQVRAGGRRLDAAPRHRAPRTARPTTPAEPPAALPVGPVDPGVPGRYRTTSGEYDLPAVRLPDFAKPVEMRATVVGPTNAPGRRPLALFLHGRHYTCFGPSADDQTGDWPCAAGSKPVPSYRGYLQAQKLLASQGYVTVSISANGINGQDDVVEDGGAQARSSLVRQHLARWAGWADKPKGAPRAVRAVAPADLSRVLLVGHSRGGEGVNRAALDSLSRPPAAQDGYRGPVRWRVRGNVLIGPTIFGQNPVPDVPSATILPGCDGDVSDLQGQVYADGTRGVSRGTALHSALYMVGANHNFFNTEWTPGQAEAPADDDFYEDPEAPDRVCAPSAKTRLSAADQQRAGATYIAAAARLFVAGDDRVRPLLDGSQRRAPSAGPARVLSHAVGGRRTPLVVPHTSLKVTGARMCVQVDADENTAGAPCLPPETSQQSPHFSLRYTPGEPERHAVALRWSKAGTPARIGLPRPVSVAGSQALALRVMVPPNTSGTSLDVTLTDAAGHRATLGRVRVDGLPGTDRTASLWGREVRVPLSAAARAGLDLKRVASLELTPRGGPGRAWLVDAWGWSPGTPTARPAALPRIDIGKAEVKEGDAGVRTHRVPIRVAGHGTGQVRLSTTDRTTGKLTYRTVTVRPGSQTIDVRFSVRGNTRYGADSGYWVTARALRGTAVGSHHGGVLVRDDDPMPKVTVTPVKDRVTEGQALSWRVTLSEAADTDIWSVLRLQAPASGAELSSVDVEKSWFEEVFYEDQKPARPLSRATEPPVIPVPVEEGKLSAVVTVPTVKDALTEPDELLQARLVTSDDDGTEYEGPLVTGTVRDAS
ncbi:hypothetical protein H7H31_06270 [Streptomyces buecherae]|nr:hypothetical protein [Streptomyces buecherae]QNJ39538.1 hypothetical protein H7H31_06270 [Streptomyces buecherae]